MGMIFGKISEEVPEFSSLGHVGSLEVRRYGEQYVATVMSSDFPQARTRDAFQSKAFRTLAGYIGVLSKPQNRKRDGSNKAQAISMTAPVMMTRNEVVAAETTPVEASEAVKKDESPQVDWSMTFILPSKFIKSGEEPPRPLNPAVHVNKMSPRLMAVKQFSWNMNEQSIETNLAEALKELKGNTKYEIMRDSDGNPAYEVFGYNAPFTLPWTKTNEVGILLREQCTTAQSGGDVSSAQSLAGTHVTRM